MYCQDCATSKVHRKAPSKGQAITLFLCWVLPPSPSCLLVTLCHVEVTGNLVHSVTFYLPVLPSSPSPSPSSPPPSDGFGSPSGMGEFAICRTSARYTMCASFLITTDDSNSNHSIRTIPYVACYESAETGMFYACFPAVSSSSAKDKM